MPGAACLRKVRTHAAAAVISVASVAVFFSPALAQNLIINPSFETNNHGPRNSPDGTAAPPWVLSGGAVITNYPVYVHSGAFALVLSNRGYQSGSADGTAAQALTLATTGTYRLSFFEKVAPSSGTFTLAASSNGQQKYAATYSNVAYNQVTADFSLNAGLNNLAFTGTNVAGGGTLFALDDFSLILLFATVQNLTVTPNLIAAAQSSNQLGTAVGLTNAFSQATLGTTDAPNGVAGAFVAALNNTPAANIPAVLDSLTGEGITAAQNARRSPRRGCSPLRSRIRSCCSAVRTKQRDRADNAFGRTARLQRRAGTADADPRARSPPRIAATVFVARLGLRLRRIAAHQRQPRARQRAAVDWHRRRLCRCRLHLGTRHAVRHRARRLGRFVQRRVASDVRLDDRRPRGLLSRWPSSATFTPRRSTACRCSATARRAPSQASAASTPRFCAATSPRRSSAPASSSAIASAMAPGVTLTPFYAVEAAKLRSDGFNETAIAGAGLFALNVRGQTASSVPMFFGARLTGDMDIGNGMRFRPSIQLAYVPELAPVRNQVAGLVNLPGAVFLTDGARPARSQRTSEGRCRTCRPRQCRAVRQLRRRVLQPRQHLRRQRRHQGELVKENDADGPASVKINVSLVRT